VADEIWDLRLLPARGNLIPHTDTGVLRVKVTGLPERVTQSVRGSLPSCSVVAPWTSVTVVGRVMGIGATHVFPLEVRVTLVMVSVVGSIL